MGNVWNAVLVFFMLMGAFMFVWHLLLSRTSREIYAMNNVSLIVMAVVVGGALLRWLVFSRSGFLFALLNSFLVFATINGVLGVLYYIIRTVVLLRRPRR